MKIRRYMAKNTQEAILKVKMDLGNEALILNTRKVKKKGLFGLFSKPMVEVLAAIDEYNVTRTEGDAVRSVEKSVEKTDGKPAEKRNSESGERNNFDEKEDKILNLENKITNMEEMLQKMCVKMKTIRQNPTFFMPKQMQLQKWPSQTTAAMVQHCM